MHLRKIQPKLERRVVRPEAEGQTLRLTAVNSEERRLYVAGISWYIHAWFMRSELAKTKSECSPLIVAPIKIALGPYARCSHNKRHSRSPNGSSTSLLFAASTRIALRRLTSHVTERGSWQTRIRTGQG
jgi:hypothetical protein